MRQPETDKYATINLKQFVPGSSRETGDASPRCRSKRGPRSDDCISSGTQSAPCALRTQSFGEGTKEAGSRSSGADPPLHLEAAMGHAHTRPTEVPPAGITPPSPRTVCALRLAQPPHRSCCPHQHLIHPEASLTFPPPCYYSPSVFRRLDRR